MITTREFLAPTQEAFDRIVQPEEAFIAGPRSSTERLGALALKSRLTVPEALHGPLESELYLEDEMAKLDPQRSFEEATKKVRLRHRLSNHYDFVRSAREV